MFPLTKYNVHLTCKVPGDEQDKPSYWIKYALIYDGNIAIEVARKEKLRLPCKKTQQKHQSAKYMIHAVNCFYI